MPNDLTTCRICFNSDASISIGPQDKDSVICKRCGVFEITGSASASWEAKNTTVRQRVNAAGWIRDHQRILLNSDDIDFLLKLEPLTVAERADKLLVALADNFPKTGREINLPFGHTMEMEWLGISWSEDQRELVYLVEQYLLMGENLLQYFHRGRSEVTSLQISAKGYRYIEELRQKPTNSNIGFCAMWFDESVQQAWTDAIAPAIGEAGYDPKRIDSHEHNNRIDDEIMAMIRRSKFIVADFTGQRGGVYFEAGFALGLRIPVIWTCSKTELEQGLIHFDNRQYSFVTWIPDQLTNFKARLQNRIEATIGRGLL